MSIYEIRKPSDKDDPTVQLWSPNGHLIAFILEKAWPGSAERILAAMNAVEPHAPDSDAKPQRDSLRLLPMKVSDFMEFFSARQDGFEWQFLPDKPTWLQTDSVRDAKARWYLTHRQGEEGDDPAYFIEIEPNAKCIIKVLTEVADKAWTDKAQLLEALLPAIRTVAWKKS